MKALLYTLPALLLVLPAAQAQDLTNNGAVITVPNGAILTVPGTIRNLAGSTLTAEGTVRIGGNLANAGTLTSAAGTVIFTGTTDQTLTPGGASLANVEVLNTGAVGNNRILLPANLTITQQLTMTSGLLRTASTATVLLPVGATLSGEGPGHYVQGKVQVTRTPAASGSVDFGNSLVLATNGNTLGNVRVTRAAGLQEAGTTYGRNPVAPTQKGIDRIWSISSDVAPATPVSLTFSWLPENDNGITDFSRSQVWRMPDNLTTWQTVGSPTNAAARSITASTSVFSSWTVSAEASPLPVELIRFTAERQGDHGLLRWTTASELRSDRFEVESSLDGHTFQRIGTVAARGTTSQPSHYQFTDADLPRYAADQVYYRLRQFDQDGTETYSPVRVLLVPASTKFVVQAWPNPSRQEVALSVRTAQAGPATVQLFDAVGRQLSQQQVDLGAGITTIALPAAQALPTGVYLLRVQQGVQQQVLRLVRE